MAPPAGGLLIGVLWFAAIVVAACGSLGPSRWSTWSSSLKRHGPIDGGPALSPSHAPVHVLHAHHFHAKDSAAPSFKPNFHHLKGSSAQQPSPAPLGSSHHDSRESAHSPLLWHWHSDSSSNHKALPPATSHKEDRMHASAPPFRVHPLAPSLSTPRHPPVIPSNHHHRTFHAPKPLPSVFSSPVGVSASGPSHSNSAPSALPSKPHSSKILPPSPALKPQNVWVLPPPPQNLDCSFLLCIEPLTHSSSGLPCKCVQPMKIGLRLSVELYTFFPLVSELAQEIASGSFLKQNQVRIMGANAGSEQPEKTVVLVDLVPLGERFDNSTAFMIWEKFWKKQVRIKMTFFGSYDVLYVRYPGLPPPPHTSTSNMGLGNGPLDGNNRTRTEHPLGVDLGPRQEKLGGSMISIIVISSVIASVLCVGVILLYFLKRNRQRCLPSRAVPTFTKVPGIAPTLYGSGRSSTSGSLSSSIATYSAKTFSAVEIEKATNKFDGDNILGEGGFGRVYRGTLEDGLEVAVKVLKREDQHGSREFLSEVEMLSRLHHRNLVKLIGICTEEHLRCLIYELIPNGSVESHLHGADKEISPLDWGARMRIALGAARGLAYLHEDSNPRVIHRDFKSSNILLDHDFTAKVSDFGLARTALEGGKEHISTRVMGTFGYVAPEYAMTGHLLVKSDVYSYGVVLLELLTGRKPVDMLRPPGQENLVTWARPLLTAKEGLEILMDPSMGSSIPLDSAAKVAAIASMCIQSEVSHRPFMGEVVQALKLVCNEQNDDNQASESCSRDDSSAQDPEIKSRLELASETGRVLSTSETFSMPIGLGRHASDSFRRRSSSGPLRPTKRSSFWQRVRGVSR